MKKLSAIIVILLLIVFTFFPKHSKQADIEKGISIDIARTHYTKDSIKKIIGELSRVSMGVIYNYTLLTMTIIVFTQMS